MKKYENPWLFKTLRIIIPVSILFILPSIVMAADVYPSKPIKFVIPHAPGAGNDLLGRLVANQLSERLGKPMVIDNRDGAGGRVGSGVVAKSAPDGYTLLFTSVSLASNPALYKTEDPMKQFVSIAKLATGPLVMVVNPTVLPVNSVKELIAAAKQKPGQLLFASGSAGSINHVAAELLKVKANIDFKVVIFKGGAQANIDLLGGHSQFRTGTLPSVLSYIRSGKLRPIGTSGKVRSSSLPDVPIIADTVPGFEITQWWGLFAPIGTPAPIVERLGRELKFVANVNEVKKNFLDEGADIDYEAPAEFATFVAADVARWHSIIKEANIKAE